MTRLALTSLVLPAAGALSLFVAATAVAEDWSQFRGPNGQGRCAQADFPVRWSENEGIVWKQAIPGRGWSSPVVCRGKIWLTTALRQGHSLRAICVALDSGRIERDVEVFAPRTPVPVNPKNTHASPSPIAEPGRIYVHYGAMGTACLDSESGKILWKNEELVVDHKEGPGSSPILFDNLLIVNCDGQDRQYVAALNKETGKIAWKTNRSGPLSDRPDFRKAFSTPALIVVGGHPQIVSTGADQVEAYDPRTGKELWRVRYSGFSNVPIPVVDRDRVYVVTSFLRPQLWAIRADGRGDVTDSHIAWKVPRQVGASPSPVLEGGRLYLVTDNGVLNCVDAESGRSLWTHRIGGTFSASPVALGGRIYFPSEQGKVTVIAAGKSFQTVAVNPLDGGFFATPCVAGHALILRTETHLYRVERSPATASRSAAASGKNGRAAGFSPAVRVGRSCREEAFTGGAVARSRPRVASDGGAAN